MAMFILFSCLLLSLSVGIDCGDIPDNGAANGRSRQISGKSEAKDEYVKFYLYKWDDPGGSKAFTIYNPQKISSIFTNFYNESKTKILVHDWSAVADCPSSIYLKDAYLSKKYTGNIIIADWNEAGGRIINYLRAVRMTREVAEQLKIFIERLYSEFGQHPNGLHVIGYGLGAHVAGVAGRRLTIGKIGRVTGLDPAKLGFAYKRSQEIIGRDSGLFVDIIHTCAGFIGVRRAIGHADFFPNGDGWRQPGCKHDLTGSCSHKRSYRFYAESIENQNAFVSTPCYSWSDFKKKKCGDATHKVPMGEFTEKSASRTYYLRTNRKPKFSKS